jgi:hypothetical protein
MGMFDTVMHEGLEWQTKSIEPGCGGTMSDYEVKDSRLWLHPYHLEDTGIEVPEPDHAEGFMASMKAFHAKHRRVEDPPEDSGFHGVLDLYRTLPRSDQDQSYQFEYRRLIFVLGQLLSEAPLTEDADHTDGSWMGDWMPKDPVQKLVWQLHSVRGLLTTITSSLDDESSQAAIVVPDLKQAESSVLEALSKLEALP